MKDNKFQVLLNIIQHKGWVTSSKVDNNTTSIIEVTDDLISDGYIDVKLGDTFYCKYCNDFSGTQKMGNYFMCTNCNKMYNLENSEHKFALSSYYPNIEKFGEILNEQFDLEYENFKCTNLSTDIWEIGVTVNGLVICLIRGKISKTQLMIIYGHLFSISKPVILLHFEFSIDAAKYLESHPLNAVFPIKIDETLQNSIKKILESYNKQKKDLDDVSKIIGCDLVPKVPVLENGRIDQETLYKLSMGGGYAFEEPAMALLWTLGIPHMIKFDKAKPEGVLLQNNGFYLIDVKSSIGSFDFRISEKDKMKRYIDDFFENVTLYPEYKPLGIGIITRDIEDNTIRNVVQYFHTHNFEGIFIIFKLDAIYSLIDMVQKNPEYWYKFDMRKHSEWLFNGRSKLKKPWIEMKERYKINNSNMVVIDLILINEYMKVVYDDLVIGNPNVLSNVSNLLLNYSS